MLLVFRKGFLGRGAAPRALFKEENCAQGTFYTTPFPGGQRHLQAVLNSYKTANSKNAGKRNHHYRSNEREFL
ncbi:MAG: hypothetical protein RI973_1369 [Bacteroidota bacterium]|jgi:hypothetical protein